MNQEEDASYSPAIVETPGFPYMQDEWIPPWTPFAPDGDDTSLSLQAACAAFMESDPQDMENVQSILNSLDDGGEMPFSNGAPSQIAGDASVSCPPILSATDESFSLISPSRTSPSLITSPPHEADLPPPRPVRTNTVSSRASSKNGSTKLQRVASAVSSIDRRRGPTDRVSKMDSSSLITKSSKKHAPMVSRVLSKYTWEQLEEKDDRNEEEQTVRDLIANRTAVQKRRMKTIDRLTFLESENAELTQERLAMKRHITSLESQISAIQSLVINPPSQYSGADNSACDQYPPTPYTGVDTQGLTVTGQLYQFEEDIHDDGA
ncbi:hypothetical protein I350_01228 [Cryptococcus amylolentus CBS 6273]|uniref:BZIP domain-containing protein n=1 Tax=Cryptococcus amylolentus CBS 6273 TaxID=1296118 RepID=A0A1E3KC19_9TREE|nr:hypothetical protein I350_01228 [Cryptococcus amylolentus CBS 6273]